MTQQIAPVAAAQVLAEADQILAGQLPTLGQVIRDAERLGAQMIAVLGRQWDPASGPSGEHWPGGPGVSDALLGNAVADVRSVLDELDRLTGLSLPPAGSAVKLPARGCTSCGSTGTHAPWCISTGDLIAAAASVTDDER